MPYCEVGKCEPNTVIASSASHGYEELTQSTKDAESVSIFYQRYGHGPTKVLLIIGLAGTHHSWGPQIRGLCGTTEPRDADDAATGARGGDDGCSESYETSRTDGSGAHMSGEHVGTRAQTGNGIEVCAFDNRGVGASSIPMLKSDYTTQKMAEDALALLDHLGWEKAHVCGHSMGGMIACKLAAIAPHRLSSLTLIGVTGGGYQCLPKVNRTSFSLAYRLYIAKTPEERSAVDLETHYTHEYLESAVGETNRRALLFKEYVSNLLNGGMQPRYGLEGQASACWNHSLSSQELDTIRSAGVIVAVIHGRGDVIAQVEHARNLAKKLRPVSRMIELPGGHLVTHQNADEVNGVLLGVIRAVRMNVQCTDFKASDAGLYDTKGGDHWQTGGTSSEAATRDQGFVGLQSHTFSLASDSAVTVFWRKVLPEWLELLYLFPFIQWISRLFGIDRLWEEVCV